MRPGGALNIRDHAPAWNPSGIDLEPGLEWLGLTLGFLPYLRGRSDLQRLHRIWRKAGSAADGLGTTER